MPVLEKWSPPRRKPGNRTRLTGLLPHFSQREKRGENLRDESREWKNLEFGRFRLPIFETIPVLGFSRRPGFLYSWLT